jgi:oligopeptidase A
MGHALQHVLTQVDEGHVSGIAGVEWDAVEEPSQFMENWLVQPNVLRSMAKHWSTNEPIPTELISKIKAADTFRAASAMVRQLKLALTDIELHDGFVPGAADERRSIWDVERAVEERTRVLAPLDDDRFLCSFRHIFAGGYSAGYYSYKWAEVLSADGFAAFEEVGLENEEAVRAVGRRYADTVLGLGGSRPAAEVFLAFRGREPQVDALLRHSNLAPEAKLAAASSA